MILMLSLDGVATFLPKWKMQGKYWMLLNMTGQKGVQKNVFVDVLIFTALWIGAYTQQKKIKFIEP